MPKFIRKRVEVEAVQWTGENLKEVQEFIDQKPVVLDNKETKQAWEHYEGLVKHGGLFISTLEGRLQATVGDWIIRGTAGEYYPCKPDIFKNLYDEATEETSGADFLEVIKALLGGMWATREEYKGNRIYVTLVRPEPGSFKGCYFAAVAGNNSYLWSPSPYDNLSTDWEILTSEDVEKRLGGKIPPPPANALNLALDDASVKEPVLEKSSWRRYNLP